MKKVQRKLRMRGNQYWTNYVLSLLLEQREIHVKRLDQLEAKAAKGKR